MTESFDAFIKQATKFQQFGNYPFELVWKDPLENPPRENELKTQLKKIAPRHPKSIRRWIMDNNGGLKEIEQYTYFVLGKSSVMKSVLINVDKLCIFVNEKDGNNWHGKSIFRTAYRYWFANDKLYNFALIGAERNAVGIPVVEIDWDIWKEISSEEKPIYLAKAKEIIEKYRIHEYAGFVLLPGMKFNFVDGKFNYRQNIQPMQQDNDRGIAECALAQFLSTGADGVGSNARFVGEAELFLLALNATAKYMAETINAHVIKKLVDFAYSDKVDKLIGYPRFTCKLPDFDVEAYFNTVNNSINSQALTPTRVVENKLRSILKIPALTEDEEGVYEKNDTGIDFAENKKHFHFNDNPVWRRELNDREKKVNFADIDKKMETAEKKLLKEVTNISKSQIKFIKREVESGKKLIDLDLPKMQELQELFKDQALELAEYGQKQVEGELNSKTIDTDQLKKYAEEIGVLQANKHKSDLMVYVRNKIPIEGVKK